MKSRKNYAAKNIGFGIINKLISIFLPFVTRSVLIYTLGIEYVGLGSLFSSILHVLNLAELGFSSAVVFNLYKPVVDDDKNKIRAYLNAYKKIYQIVGLIILVFGLALTPFIHLLIKDSGIIDVNLYVLFIIYVLNSSLSYLFFAYKSSLFIANQRNDVIHNINSIVTVTQSLLAVLALVLLKNYYAYSVTVLIGTMLNNLLIYFVFRKKYSEFSPRGDLTKEEKKNLKQNVLDLFGHKIGGVFLNTFDSIVISAFLGAVMLGIYSNYYTIMSSISAIMVVISSSLRPSVGNKIASANIEENYAVFKKVNFFYKWIATWFTACLVCLFPPFMKLWLKDDALLLSFNFVVLFGLYFYFINIKNILCIYKDAGGFWHSDRFRPYVETISNILGNIILIHFLGLSGILISTIFTLVFVCNPWLTSSLFKDYFKKSPKEYYLGFVYNFAVMIVATVATYFICFLLPSFGLWAFVIKIAVCAIVPNIILFLFYFKSPELKYYFELAKNFFKKKNKKKFRKSSPKNEK